MAGKPPLPPRSEMTAALAKNPKPTRRLFLDDDPERASTFLAAYPDAVWVQTVPECVARLLEPWDEVHLDHDLGGEVYVDVHREDCGMEVVRWLAKEPRKHLRKARFTVHSHNMAAAFEMSYRLQVLGYRVEARPFGIEPPPLEPSTSAGRWRKLKAQAQNLIRWARGLEPIPDPHSGDPDPADYVP